MTTPGQISFDLVTAGCYSALNGIYFKFKQLSMLKYETKMIEDCNNVDTFMIFIMSACDGINRDEIDLSTLLHWSFKFHPFVCYVYA